MNTVTIPCVVLISPTTALIANFGQRDFSFAIVQHLAQERCNAVTQAIEDKLTADLANVEMQRWAPLLFCFVFFLKVYSAMPMFVIISLKQIFIRSLI